MPEYKRYIARKLLDYTSCVYHDVQYLLYVEICKHVYRISIYGQASPESNVDSYSLSVIYM
jgi:hypothetical protein